jgi:hypothetical protein
MTVCVPRALKARMEQAAANWSAVATVAFEAKLVALQSEQKPRNRDEKIARWRAADEIDAGAEHAAGVETGREWARDTARPRQLRRLEALDNDPQADIDQQLSTFTAYGNPGIAVCLYCALQGCGVWDDDVTDDHLEAFWRQAIGVGGRQRITDLSFAGGFCKGAMAEWCDGGDEV